MKRSLLAAGAVAAALGVTGCKGNTDTPISGSEVNPCNGETVDFSGVLHNNFNLVGPDGQGGFNAEDHVNFADVHGVGETTGAKYVITSGQIADARLHLLPGVTVTFQFDEHIISQGSAPNFVFHQLVHVTADANGDVTSSVDNFRTECQGG